jgi:chemotaxis regulatin CheY-phosphate phosphatase CheZ
MIDRKTYIKNYQLKNKKRLRVLKTQWENANRNRIRILKVKEYITKINMLLKNVK